METNLSTQKQFFQSLKKGQLIRSYFNSEKIFEATGEERLNSKDELEKQIKGCNFQKKEYWITEIDCCSNGTIIF
jgi:hypothetical protein